MKQWIIDKFKLQEIEDFWFGVSFVHNIKTYYVNKDFVCYCANNKGEPLPDGQVMFRNSKKSFILTESALEQMSIDDLHKLFL